jgi:hypothetical protein
MIRNRTLWLPVVAMCALAGTLGATQGLRLAARGETPVIEAMAARHVVAGGAATDCAARPGQGWLAWLVVTCGQGTAAREYHVNRLGWLVREAAPGIPNPET